MSAQTLSHSRLACFRTCPRKHHIRYELGIRPEEKGFALRVGSAFHLALDTIEKGGGEEAISEALATLEDPYDLAMVAAMVNGHAQRWADALIETIASELRFEMLLRNPETGASTPVWILVGVLDRLVRLDDGRIALMEHKTTSRDFSPGADYWVQLHMDMQLSIYVIAAREFGFDVATILYDVTRRPQQRPHKATPEDKRKYKADGKLYAKQRAEDETPEAFAARVAEDIAAKPDHYFARIEIARLDQDLEECSAELWQQQKAIRIAQLAGYWYRNPGACFTYYPCEYLPICQNRDLETATPNGFIRAARPAAAQGASPVCHAQASGRLEEVST